MSDDHMFLAHRGALLAKHLVRMSGGDWRSEHITDAWNEFMNFFLDPHRNCTNEQRDAYWKSYQSTTDDFLLLRANSFNHTWTTPSGYLWDKADFIDPGPGLRDYGKPAIFQISFDSDLIAAHALRK